jgi:hypothetical protein
MRSAIDKKCKKLIPATKREFPNQSETLFLILCLIPAGTFTPVRIAGHKKRNPKGFLFNEP